MRMTLDVVIGLLATDTRDSLVMRNGTSGSVAAQQKAD